MSTMLEGQLVAWRGSTRTRERIALADVVRAVVIVAAVAAAVVYFATRSQIPAVASGLIREAAATRETRSAQLEREMPAEAYGGVEVTLRQSARNARPLQP